MNGVGKAVLLLCCWLALPAVAELVPPAGALDARVRTVMYHPEELYRLQGFVGYAIHLTFEEGERFEGLSGGDLEGIGWDAEGNHLFLKPRAPRLMTNLTLLTSRRAYELLYSVSVMTSATPRNNITYVVHFSYPPLTDTLDDAQAAARRLAQLEPTRRNEDYWYCGAAALKPTSVWDDGAKTWIRFNANTEWPAVFALSEDGEESLVNYSVEGADLIVHRLAARFVVRRGRLTGCIQNRGFAKDTPRNESGTASPQIERTVRGES